MRIVLCSQAFKAPLVGGVDVYTDRLARALNSLGHQVLVLAVDGSGETEHPIIEPDHLNGLEIQRLVFDLRQRPARAFDLLEAPELRQLAREALASFRAELLIMMNFYLPTFSLVEAALDLDLPVVHVATDFLPICRRGTFIRWHGRSCEVGESLHHCSECYVSHRLMGRSASSVMRILPEESLASLAGAAATGGVKLALRPLAGYFRQVRWMAGRLERLQPLREAIRLVLAPTRFTEQMFLENGFRADQVRFLPFGIEPDRPAASTPPPQETHAKFLFVGRLQPYKGLHVLLDAFNGLADPQDAKLVIYGTFDGHDQYYSDLEKKIRGNPQIEFRGRIAPEDLPQAFAEAGYFILPSTWHENSPLIVLDALQSQTPVISSAIGGITDIIEHDVNGLLFPMGNVDALKHLLQQAIHEPGLLARLQQPVALPTIADYAQELLALSGFAENR
jgi:glycosyltransferase involved in cell wall biosynthesis